MASGAVDCLASGSIQRPYCLLAVCGFLILAVIAVFGQTIGHDFVNYDDDEYVYENRHVRGGLTGAGTAWAIATYHSFNWHPLTWLSHMLDCQLYDLRPGGHHLTNEFLHAAAAILLFLALRRMTGALWPSAWVAAVFAVHPLRVESVAWVAERKDVLSGLFFMLTLWLYARYVERPASWRRYLLVVASFVLGLTAKPILVTLPFVLLLLDYWPLGRLGPPQSTGQEDETSLPRPDRPLVRLVVEKIPLFVLAAASCMVTLAAQCDAMRSLELVSPAGRITNAAVAYVTYLGKMFCPTGLAVPYLLPKGPPPVWEVVSAVTVILAISTAAFAARRKCPYLLFGWFWYLGTLAPVIGLVQVGDQAMADRYTYLTQIGLYTTIASGATHLAGCWPDLRWLFAAVSALIVAGLMVCAWQQTQRWRDSTTLFTHTLDCTSQNYIAHNNLGLALARRGEVDEAIVQYRKALEFEPDYVVAHINLGTALASHGRFDEAIAHCRRALEIQPDYVEAHNNLGNALAGCGRVDEAIGHYRKVLEVKPDDAVTHYNLGNAFADCGRVNEAIAHYRKALEIEPEYVGAHNNLGLALAGRGQVDEAIGHYRKALEIKPDDLVAHYNLGVALARRGEVDEAIAHYQKALGLASAGNDRAMAGVIRARIRVLQSGAPVGKTP